MQSYAIEKRMVVIGNAWVGLAVIAIAAYCHWSGAPVSAFTRDIAAIADINPLNGVVSSMGMILWAAATAVAAFAAWMSRSGSVPSKQCLATTAGLSGVLLIDDLFMIHEVFFGQVLGLSEIFAFGLYGLLALLWLGYWYRQILELPLTALWLSALAFGISFAADALDAAALLGADYGYLVEDGAKLIGIVNWVVFVWLSARYALSPQAAGEFQPPVLGQPLETSWGRSG